MGDGVAVVSEGTVGTIVASCTGVAVSVGVAAVRGISVTAAMRVDRAAIVAVAAELGLGVGIAVGREIAVSSVIMSTGLSTSGEETRVGGGMSRAIAEVSLPTETLPVGAQTGPPLTQHIWYHVPSVFFPKIGTGTSSPS